MLLFPAAIDSGWALVLIGASSAVAGGIVWLLEQLRQRRKRIGEEAVKEANAPAENMVATTRAAEAIARASASLIKPFQDAVRAQEGQLGELREAVRNVQARERQCQQELAECRSELEGTRVELHETRRKLREVTDKLGIDPDGLPPQ